ncbi:cupin domain-containing protein [Nevskia ramosa]|uniref:cupin domain-containing protein n=1 Tax=Nevskia ramosa TaxID=64002 RepID=UPI003D111ED5
MTIARTDDSAPVLLDVLRQASARQSKLAIMIQRISPLMKSLVLLLALGATSAANAQQSSGPVALHPDDVAKLTVSPGVTLKELTGRVGAPAAQSTMGSVALFRLEPGRASAWSHNKVGEESFFILKGKGEVWTGNQAHAVRPGSFILIPPSVVRSIRASKGETLEFYAVTTPAWSADDDVLVQAPEGAPK